MKSIMQDESERYCFICKSTQYLERHHAWHGSSNRKKADEDGLTVYLCSFCHRALHDKGTNDRYLMETAEKAYLSHYNATIEDFIKRYGKNAI